MALNPFFQQGTTAEQNLVQSLINEQLKIYGVEVYYIPRIFINTNSVIREVIQSEFTNAYPLEAYIQNFEGFQGSGDLMSKFGVRVTDELNLIISQERYETYIKPILDGGVPSDSGGALMPNAIGTPSVDYELVSRPKEGDLIWFPLSDTIFEVKYVEHEQPFYQLKKNYVYELRCEIFEYDNEVIDTGVSDIDDNVADDGYILTMNLAGIGSTATATTGISTGSVTQLFLTNAGFGYTTTPLVTITEPSAGGTRATAVAIMTSTTFGTKYVDDLRIINPGSGYSEPPIIRFISSDGVGAAATAGISTLGSITSVTVTSGGSEYLTTPTVTFSAPESGVTATGIAKVSSNSVIQVQVTNSGYGYTQSPTVTISDPSGISTGTYEFNEIVTGSESLSSARVKEWDAPNKVLKVGMITGDFKIGENIVGAAATFNLKSTGSSVSGQASEFDTSSPYDANVSIEQEGINIIDFTEKTPFGIF